MTVSRLYRTAAHPQEAVELHPPPPDDGSRTGTTDNFTSVLNVTITADVRCLAKASCYSDRAWSLFNASRQPLWSICLG
jgi:hypothetical protein